MRPDDELLELIDRRRRIARELPGWRSGPRRLLTLLQHATRLRAMEIAQKVETNVPWESVFAQLITWHYEIPLGEGSCGDKAALDICVAALEATRLDNLYGTIRAGGYEVRRRGDSFRVRHRWNPAVEAADAFLEFATAPERLPEVSSLEKAWITGRRRSSRDLPPSDVLLATAKRAEVAINAYRSALPEGNLSDSFQLDGGLTVGHAATVMSVIMGLASLCEYTARDLKRTETTLLQMRRTKLLEVVADITPTVPLEHIDSVIERLLFSVGRSCRVSPLAEIDGVVLICPPLITPRVIDAIVLRGAAYDPSRYGSIGQRQGARATRWKEWLSQIPGVLVAERVRARRTDRRVAGDIDVMAVDPQQSRGICFEIKWPIDAISLPEVMKIEDWVSSAAAQVDRLRGELVSGTAAVETPRGWPEFSDVSWTWAVATPQQLCLRPLPFSEIYATSFRYMIGHGVPESLSDVTETLTSPDLPIEGVHFEVKTVDFVLGRQKVALDGIGLSTDGWAPRPWR